MDKTFAAIEKLKEVELELHRLKNYAELMNRSVEAKKEWVGLTDEETIDLLPAGDWEIESTLLFAQRIEETLKEKNSG